MATAVAGQALHENETFALHTILFYCLAFVLAFQLTAMLVVSHKSRPLRLALLPFTLWTAFRLTTQFEAASRDDLRYRQLSQSILGIISILLMRVVGWTFDGEKYWRVGDHGRTQTKDHESLAHIFGEALALTMNARGVGWNWGKGAYIPSQPKSRSMFIRERIGSIIVHILAFCLIVPAVKFLSPSQSGGGIYDMSLPLVPRHLLATTVSILLAIMILLFNDTSHSVFALVAVLLFRDDPVSWPPLFNAPWLSTSLSEFWGRRWHQVLRHVFVSTGGRPLSVIFGRAGHVMGTFFLSGVAHALGSWHVGKKDECLIVIGCFLALGSGIILERLWRDLTGHRVGGTPGRIWAFVWLACWANILFDTWSRSEKIENHQMSHTSS